MEPIIVDYDKCNADGICADVCPRKLIVVDAEDSMPRPIPEAVELCISCGHWHVPQAQLPSKRLLPKIARP